MGSWGWGGWVSSAAAWGSAEADPGATSDDVSTGCDGSADGIGSLAGSMPAAATGRSADAGACGRVGSSSGKREVWFGIGGIMAACGASGHLGMKGGAVASR